MNKSEFIDFIASKHNCSKTEANKIIDVFTDSVIGALGEGKKVNLIGFGSFYTNKVEARTGRNPKTGASMSIPASNQPRFSAGQKLKDACNKK
jgi:DNA-binding protein HU-beta